MHFRLFHRNRFSLKSLFHPNTHGVSFTKSFSTHHIIGSKRSTKISQVSPSRPCPISNVELKTASKMLELVVEPACLIDEMGFVLLTNQQFEKTVKHTQQPHRSIYYIACAQENDRISNALNILAEHDYTSSQSMSTSIRHCITQTNHYGLDTNESFDWTFSSSLDVSYIMVHFKPSTQKECTSISRRSHVSRTYNCGPPASGISVRLPSSGATSFRQPAPKNLSHAFSSASLLLTSAGSAYFSSNLESSILDEGLQSWKNEVKDIIADLLPTLQQDSQNSPMSRISKRNEANARVNEIFTTLEKHLLNQTKELKEDVELAQTDLVEFKRLLLQKLNHELRTPLMVILSGILGIQQELLLEGGGDSNKAIISNEIKTLIEQTLFSTHTATHVLNDLSIFESLENTEDTVVLNKVYCNIIAMTEELMMSYQIQAKMSKISLYFSKDFLDDVLFVHVDKGLLHQVLRNFLANALAYTPAGGTVVLKLSIHTKNMPSESSVLRIEVTDSGPGPCIPLVVPTTPTCPSSPVNSEKNRPRSEKRPSPLVIHNVKQDSSLGVDISTRILKLHDTELTITGGLNGKGSCYSFDLPIADELDDSFAHSRSTNSLSSTMSRTASTINASPSEQKLLRVLIVEDSVLCRKMTVRSMLRFCSSCVEAGDGQEAVNIMERALSTGLDFDLILMDSSMPTLDGTIAAQRIRALGYTGRIVGVTGNCLPADIQDFLEHGADKVLIKPLTSSDYAEIIEDTKLFQDNY